MITLKRKLTLTYHQYLHYESRNLVLMVDTALTTTGTLDVAVVLLVEMFILHL